MHLPPRPGWSLVLILMLSVLPARQPAAAATPAAHEPRRDLSANYSHRSWSRAEGMTEAHVTALRQTRDGFLWIGTVRGLMRFDGREFKAFSRTEIPRLDPDEIRDLAEDRDGRLWASAPRAIFSWDGQAIRFAPTPTHLPSFSKYPAHLLPTRDGDLFALCSEGFFLVGNARSEFHTEAGGIKYEGGAVLQTRDGVLWWGLRSLARMEHRGGPLEELPLPELKDSSSGNWLLSGLYPHPCGGLIVCLTNDRYPFGVQMWHFEQAERRWTQLVDWLPANGSNRFFSFMDSEAGLWIPNQQEGLLRLGFPGPAQGQALGPLRIDQLRVPWTNPSDLPSCGLEDRDGNLWVGTEKSGVHMFHPKPMRSLTLPDGLPHENVWCVQPTGPDLVWVGTSGGAVAIQTGSTMEDSSLEPPAPSSTPLNPGSVPTNDRRTSPRAARTLGAAEGLECLDIRALALDSAGLPWIGTARGLYLLLQGKAVRHRFVPHLAIRARYSDPQEQGWNKIRVIARDQQGAMWVGVPSGVHRVRGSEDTFFTRDEHGRDEMLPDVRALQPTRDGGLWVGFDGQGLLRFPRELVAAPRISQAEVPGTPFERIVSDHFPNLQGTNRALWPPPPPSAFPTASARSNSPPLPLPASHVMLGSKQGLTSDHITCLLEDVDGILWVGTDIGLNRVALAPGTGASDPATDAPARNYRVTAYGKAEGLPSHGINSLVEDDFGDLWIGTDRGISRVSRAELNAIALGRSSRVTCSDFDEGDGMISAETNGSMNGPGATRTPDGRLWFATVQGVVVVDPRSIRSRNPKGPPVSIHQVLADDQVVLGDDSPAPPSTAEANTPARATMLLPPGRARVLEFHYTTPSFVRPEQAQFRYRLEGYETSWHEAGPRRVAYYTNLRPGSYRFQVQAAGHENIWNVEGAMIPFALAPFYWQTWWFWTAIGVMGAALLALLVAWRLWETRRFHQLQAAADVTQERIRIAQDLHDGLGSGLTQLRLLAALAEREKPDAAALDHHLHQIVERTKAVADTLRDIIWVARPQSATVQAVVDRVCQHAEQHLGPVGIAYRFELPDDLPAANLGDVLAQNLFYAAREALTNILKHSGATRVHVRAEIRDARLVLQIQDNGRGLSRTAPGGSSPGTSRGGIGLRSMRQRMAISGGRCEWVSSPGEGTTITLEGPIPAVDATDRIHPQ